MRFTFRKQTRFPEDHRQTLEPEYRPKGDYFSSKIKYNTSSLSDWLTTDLIGEHESKGIGCERLREGLIIVRDRSPYSIKFDIQPVRGFEGFPLDCSPEDDDYGMHFTKTGYIWQDGRQVPFFTEIPLDASYQGLASYAITGTGEPSRLIKMLLNRGFSIDFLVGKRQDDNAFIDKLRGNTSQAFRQN